MGLVHGVGRQQLERGAVQNVPRSAAVEQVGHVAVLLEAPPEKDGLLNAGPWRRLGVPARAGPVLERARAEAPHGQAKRPSQEAKPRGQAMRPGSRGQAKRPSQEARFKRPGSRGQVQEAKP